LVIRENFEKYGEIKKIKLGKSFGCVWYLNHNEAVNAQLNMDGSTIGKSTIEVRLSHD
jgi:hypothetical protein